MNDTTINLNNFGGLAFSYSVLCERKFWLFENQIQFENTNENVKIGKEIEENYYLREHKNIQIEGANIDFFKDGMVYEVKKSSHSKEFAVLQIKYYLYLLSKKGMQNVSGVLKIPEERVTKKIELDDADILKIEEQLEKAKKILNNPIPKVERKKICSKCAYYEFCFVEE